MTEYFLGLITTPLLVIVVLAIALLRNRKSKWSWTVSIPRLYITAGWNNKPDKKMLVGVRYSRFGSDASHFNSVWFGFQVWSIATYLMFDFWCKRPSWDNKDIK